MNCKKLAIAAAMILNLSVTGYAYAGYQELITENFASGASFKGIVTFDDNLVATSVNGILTGYQLGSVGYQGNAFSESISWVQDNTFNYASAPLSSNFLLDADPGVFDGSINNSLLFTIDFSNSLAPVFTSGINENGINTLSSYADSLISGTIQAVPEAESHLMLLLGLATLSIRSARKWFS